jgi:UTP--glucose-1-phosphate uridylyltransferase
LARVKTTDDLLAVRSDAYVLTGDWQIRLNPARRLPGPPIVNLDARFYRLIDDLEARFPYGPPSLVECERLEVRGDVRFGRGIICRGPVEIDASDSVAIVLPNGLIAEGAIHQKSSSSPERAL